MNAYLAVLLMYKFIIVYTLLGSLHTTSVQVNKLGVRCKLRNICQYLMAMCAPRSIKGKSMTGDIS